MAAALYAARARRRLQSYCARELDRWHERLVRKGRHLKTLGASRRHRVRIKAKRFRYMLEALKETVVQGPRNSIACTDRQNDCSARWATCAISSASPILPADRPQAENGKRGKKRPPGYRQQREKLLGVAVAAHRDLGHAGVR